MPNGISILPIIVLGIIFITGLLNVINPKMMWKVFEGWKATSEPSTAYFISRRLGGLFAVAIVLLIILVPYLLSK